MNYYNATWFIFGIIVGYFVGWVFAKFGHDIPEGKDRDLVKTIIVKYQTTADCFSLCASYSLGLCYIQAIPDGQNSCSKRVDSS